MFLYLVLMLAVSINVIQGARNQCSPFWVLMCVLMMWCGCVMFIADFRTIGMYLPRNSHGKRVNAFAEFVLQAYAVRLSHWESHTPSCLSLKSIMPMIFCITISPHCPRPVGCLRLSVSSPRSSGMSQCLVSAFLGSVSVSRLRVPQACRRSWTVWTRYGS